jgi:hypothetical protein
LKKFAVCSGNMMGLTPGPVAGFPFGGLPYFTRRLILET